MKSFKELAEGLNHKVPVYHADRKTLVGHVSSGATSIGAAKLAKKKSAIFSRVNGEYSWVASGDLKESKYGDAMSSRLPAHLDYPTHDKYGRSNYGTTKAKQPAAPKPKRDKEMDERLDKWDAQQQTMTEAKRQVAEPKWGKKDYDDAAERYKTMPRKGRKGFDYKKFSAYRDKNPHMFIAGLEEETHMQHDPETKKASLFGSKKGDALDRYYGSRHAAIIKAKKLEESLTPRERMSGAERLKPKEQPPVDQAETMKKDATHAQVVTAKARKTPSHTWSQGGNDAGSKQALKSLKESDIAFNESGGKAPSHSEVTRLYRKHLADPKNKDVHKAYRRAYSAHAEHGKKEADKMFAKDPYGDAHLQEDHEAQWTKRDQWGYTPTHGNTQHHQLVHHGWEKGPAKIYTHPELKGHAIALDAGSGKFTHSIRSKAMHALSPDLTKHLEMFHGGIKKMQEAYDMAFNESSDTYKVGDKVIPKIGPHKGTVHTVIHVHPTGHLNIKPDVHVRSNRYHLGAAKADPKDVERAPLKESSSDGMSFHKAIHHAKAYGNRVTYGTASRKWHSIDSKDRDFHTSFALDPDEAHRQGEAKSLLHSTQSRHLEEASSKRRFYADKQERDPSKWIKNRGKQFKKWPDEMRTTNTGINRKTIQEVFQAAKDKKAGKQDNLPQSQEGANEPGKEKFDAPTPQPQGQGGDAPKTQDGGAPGAQEKKNNTPKPEASKNAKKLVPKGGEQFQADPFVTPLTTMPDTASPKSGSQGVR